MIAIRMIQRIRISFKFEQLHQKMKLRVNASRFRLCESNINNLKSKWSREIPQAQVLTTAFTDGERNLLPKIILFYKILPVHHDCNSNDQEHLHKLRTQAASSKIRNMSFRLKIKISVNSSQFRTIWNSNGQEKKKNASANNSLQLWERNLLPEIK